MCKPACWTYVWGTAKPSGSVSSIYTNCSLTVPDSKEALFPWCLGTNGEILLKWLSASRLRFALTFSWLCLIQRVVWMNKEKGSSRRCSEQPGKAKWLMRLKGRVDLPTSTQTPVPRTEYEMSLSLSMACQEDSSAFVQALLLVFWKQKDRISCPIWMKLRDWARASYHNQRVLCSNTFLFIFWLLIALPEALRMLGKETLSGIGKPLLVARVVLAPGFSKQWSLMKMVSFGFHCDVSLVPLCTHWSLESLLHSVLRKGGPMPVSTLTSADGWIDV